MNIWFPDFPVTANNKELIFSYQNSGSLRHLILCEETFASLLLSPDAAINLNYCFTN